jgi:hypothetical protein
MRPAVAVRIAQYIAEWSELDSLLGLFVALLLHANQKTVIAIYSGLESRAAQLRMLTSAAKAALSPDHFDVVATIMKIDVRPAMKFRDKLAHWSWGYTDELSEALLIREPSEKLANLTDWVEFQRIGQVVNRNLSMNFDRIYVLTQPDIDRALKQISEVQERFLVLLGTVWERNTHEARSQLLQRLKDMPRVRSELDRLAASRTIPSTAPPPPESKPSGTQ